MRQHRSVAGKVKSFVHDGEGGSRLVRRSPRTDTWNPETISASLPEPPRTTCECCGMGIDTFGSRRAFNEHRALAVKGAN